jgi:selenophosphate synthetase-related protein
MTDEGPLGRLLRTDPRDVGCDEAWALVHVYAELVAAGADPEEQFPGVTAHLAQCGPCAEDFQGLLLQLRDGVADQPSDRRST